MLPVVDAQARLPASCVVQVGVRGREGRRFVRRRVAEAVAVVMAVALAVRQAEQREQREVLLHRESGLAGQVFGRHEVARRGTVSLRLRIPALAARAVDERLVQALAGLARDAAPAEFGGVREGIEACRRPRRSAAAPASAANAVPASSDASRGSGCSR